MKYISTNMKKIKNDIPSVMSLDVAPSPKQETKWTAALNAYKKGELFNVVLRGVGSIGDFEISKNRIYTNDAIVQALKQYNDLINEYPYYRMMFDAHPSSENDEILEMGESNTYDDIAAYILNTSIDTINIKGRNHKAITFNYVITKQSVLDYFMRSIEPVLAISHRGFMGDIKQLARNDIKTVNKNVTFMNEVFKSLDFQNPDSNTIDYVNVLKLLGFDLVTYPADFLCQSRKQDIIDFNVVDMKSINKVSYNIPKNQNDIVMHYMLDSMKNQSSPIGMIRMKNDDNYLKNNLKSTKVYDEVRFILNTNKEVDKMKLNLEKLTDKDYMVGIFNDLDNIFTDIDAIWDKDSNNIGNWIKDQLNDDVKETLVNDTDLNESLKSLMDNVDSFKEVYDGWYADKLYAHNREIVQVMIDVLGEESYKKIIGQDFKSTDDEIVSMLENYKNEDTFKDLCSQINENVKAMADDADYFKKISEEVLTNSTTSGEVNTSDTKITDVDTPAQDSGESIVDPTTKTESQDTQTNDPTDKVPTADGLTFEDEPSEEPWNGNAVYTACSDIVDNSTLSDEDLQSLIDEVFAIVRGYEIQDEWKLPHHDISVDNDNGDVDVTLNKAGLLAAAQAILGARTKLVASKDEKKAAAEHLLKHYNDISETPPEALVKVSENVKFIDLVSDDDLVLTLDDDFIKNIVSSNEYLKNTLSLDGEDNLHEIMDSLYTVMKPFIKDGAQISVDENMFKKLAQSLNYSAINIASILNGENSKVMEIEDSEVLNTMRNEIVALKSELTTTKDNVVTLTNEREDLISKIGDYETKLQTLDSMTQNVDHVTKMIDDMNNLNKAKLGIIFNHRSTIDDDIFNEINACTDMNQLGQVEKWVNKMSKFDINKVVVTDKFKLDTEPSGEEQTVPSVNKGTVLNLNKKKEEKKKQELGTVTGSVVGDIINLIKNK